MVICENKVLISCVVIAHLICGFIFISGIVSSYMPFLLTFKISSKPFHFQAILGYTLRHLDHSRHSHRHHYCCRVKILRQQQCVPILSTPCVLWIIHHRPGLFDYAISEQGPGGGNAGQFRHYDHKLSLSYCEHDENDVDRWRQCFLQYIGAREMVAMLVVTCSPVSRNRSGRDLEVMKLFSCSAQLRLKFILLINVKMPTIVGILTFISRINYRLWLSKPGISVY